MTERAASATDQAEGWRKMTA